MKTSYIYSVSRVNALSQFLLTKTDIERLLVAEPGEDLQSALKETYLAPYVAHVPDESVSLAIEQNLIEAKRLMHRISPIGDIFRPLWIQYDIHNLRVFAKATAKQMTFEECKPLLSERGIHNPAYLYSHVENKTLDHLQSEWQVAYDKAVQTVEEGNIHRVDGIFDEVYFATCKRIEDTLGDSFMTTYVAHLIDLYNLKSRLRHLQNETVSFKPSFIVGGTFDEEKIETQEDTLAMFSRYGGEDYWKEAVENYQTTGDSAQIDSRSSQYFLILAKESCYDMFSSASLVLYYLKCRQAAANIRTIVVGKNSGMPEADIRSNLRMAYVND